MCIIRYYEIVLSLYHSEIVARIRFEHNGELCESALYSISEVNNIIKLWTMGELLGSFAMGTRLERGADFQMVSGDIRESGLDVNAPNWEDVDLTCDHCGQLIESAYGEVDE